MRKYLRRQDGTPHTNHGYRDPAQSEMLFAGGRTELVAGARIDPVSFQYFCVNILLMKLASCRGDIKCHHWRRVFE